MSTDDTTSTVQSPRPHKKEGRLSAPTIAGPRTENIIRLVVNPKKTRRKTPLVPQEELPVSRVNLIKLTRKLAEDAEKGTLKGVGGFAEYEDGYIFGLEGSYLVDPSTAALPLLQLQKRVMDGISEQDDD